MATIYCSAKLSTLLNLPKNPNGVSTAAVDPHSWNAMLFYLNKRKCLLFMHKSILYSFLALDIVKKDLADFTKFFRQHFTDQLLADQLINPQTQAMLDTVYDSIILLPTDNDKRIIGSMNDCIQRVRFYEYREGDTLVMKPTYLGHQLNRTPMGTIEYAYPVEKMKDFIKNH
ncbi:MAG: hypothetical protein NTU98_07985 [Bacteroidetes bacterium]|nr:hypothetical protein [Bacteroidota bacterium]